MGIFDFLRKSNPPAGGVSSDKKVAGLAKVVADKRAQTYDRLDAIQSLGAMKGADAAAALLRRFTFSIDPSITDQEEKDLAFRGIVDAGKDAVPAVVEFCLKAEALTWPLKVLRAVLDEADYRVELVRLLDRFDTEYARNVEPKQQLIVALGDIKGDDVRIAVERFLDDVNETVRFHAVQTIFSQDSEASVPALVKMLPAEESVRVKNKVAEGLLARGWTVPAELRGSTNEALQDSNGFSVGPDGKLRKGAGYG